MISWCHVCFYCKLYIFFVLAFSTSKFSTGLIRNGDLLGYMPMMPSTRRDHAPAFKPQPCDDSASNNARFGDNSNLTGWESPSIPAHQASQHPFLAFMQEPTTAENAVQRPIYRIVWKPYSVHHLSFRFICLKASAPQSSLSPLARFATRKPPPPFSPCGMSMGESSSS